MTGLREVRAEKQLCDSAEAQPFFLARGWSDSLDDNRDEIPDLSRFGEGVDKVDVIFVCALFPATDAQGYNHRPTA